VDTRHFELQDLLSAALIAVEAGDRAGAEAALRKALRWVEADWLATPAELRVSPAPAGAGEADDAEDD
jgi:hypothetical protein